LKATYRPSKQKHGHRHIGCRRIAPAVYTPWHLRIFIDIDCVLLNEPKYYVSLIVCGMVGSYIMWRPLRVHMNNKM